MPYPEQPLIILLPSEDPTKICTAQHKFLGFSINIEINICWITPHLGHLDLNQKSKREL